MTVYKIVIHGDHWQDEVGQQYLSRQAAERMVEELRTLARESLLETELPELEVVPYESISRSSGDIMFYYYP